MKRVLVTTALEETWPSAECPQLFLGEWCRLYNRKTSWAHREAEVVPYHWNNREKLYKDYIYLQELYEELLVELVANLNSLHGVNHSMRYWRIVVGPWLSYFVEILFDRWSSVDVAVRHYDISEAWVLCQTGEALVPNNMSDLTSLMVCDIWNEAVFGQLVAWAGVPLKNVALVENIDLLGGGILKRGAGNKIKGALSVLVNNMSRTFSSNNSYYFINSCLPLRQELLLQLKLGQLPQLWRPVAAPPKHPINMAMRKWGGAEPRVGGDFLAILRAMIPRQIPSAYVEGYSNLVSVAKNCGWPKSPKVIFTCNAHSADDVFKTWAADMVERGVPLIIGQHGGGYGVMKWFSNERHEETISDGYLTWGWKDSNSSNIHRLGMIKKIGKKDLKEPGKADKLLLVQQSLPRYSYKMAAEPGSSTFLSYIEEQFEFISCLPSEIVKAVVVRLYPTEYGWNQADRWLDRYPDICLDNNGADFATQMQHSRIVVGTHNGTTFLESLTLNFPTIIFWNPKHWELRDSALPYFEKLKSVGIFHDTPESAALQVAVVWNDVTGWWDSAGVQSVRQEFCEKYAHVPERPLDAMEQLFRNIANSPGVGMDSSSCNANGQ